MSGKQKVIDLENYLSTSVIVSAFFFFYSTQLHYNFFYETWGKEAIYILKSWNLCICFNLQLSNLFKSSFTIELLLLTIYSMKVSLVFSRENWKKLRVSSGERKRGVYGPERVNAIKAILKVYLSYSQIITHSLDGLSFLHLEAPRSSLKEVATAFQGIILIINCSIFKFTPHKPPRQMTQIYLKGHRNLFYLSNHMAIKIEKLW